MKNTIPEVILNDGLALPRVGFGTYTLNGAAGVQAILSAINIGYRLLDSAFNYENEGVVGEAVRRSFIPREQLLITSKLPGRHHSYNEAITTIQESLYRANLDYYDLYLIHWPNPIKNLYVEAWQALIDAKKWGLIRSIGVCNFLPEHIERLIQETGVIPSINQIELHPFFSQKEQLIYNQKHGIITESWSPLGRKNTLLMENKELLRIAETHHKSISQIILRWHIQLGSIPIPKSSSPKRQLENLALFDFTLSEQDMMMISTLNQENGRLANQNPASYEEF
ncbi:Aldo/keto reductase [Propionispira arboris]|uniref:Aldo/keto reductase n=1 Tax=Propionispira arboris TaxID=84035 RepID=A0A1H6YYV8_9FIRM|nr:aldo/keto reductase [Propionispira arboris]SEJ42562.1 Aldo/keto reductase [Propionispira arboris]